jgi:transposase
MVSGAPAAPAEAHTSAQFQRLRARRGPKKVICAVAASILTATYHMLRDGTCHQDLGPDHFARRSRGDRTPRLVRQLTAVGYTIQPSQFASA